MSLRKATSRVVIALGWATIVTNSQLIADDASGTARQDSIVQLSSRPTIRLIANSNRVSRLDTRGAQSQILGQIGPDSSQQTDEALPLVPALDEGQATDRAETAAVVQNRPLVNEVKAVDLSLSNVGNGLIPEPNLDWLNESTMALPDGSARGAAFYCVNWQSSNICHFPLYFEDAMLERHGHVRFGRFQPWVSGIKFFGTISLIPYLKTLQPTCQTRYVLGHYRPGTCAPALRDTLPWDRDAAVVETLSLASFFWAAPL